jgi:uncharacterized protein YecT (DUF1311 family)
MQAPKKVLLFASGGIALFGGASAFAAQGERAARLECSDASSSQADMHECLAKKARASEVALRKAEDEVRSRLSKWPEAPRYVSLARTKLEASDKGFAKYRETQCKFNYSLGGGAIGNALDLRYLACISELNSRRAEQLKDVVSDLPTK